MAIFVKTGQCPRLREEDDQGEFTEIVSERLCGAKNVLGEIRWLGPGQHLDVRATPDAHQLFYLMEGEGRIVLAGREYSVSKGAGLYLGPAEDATIRQTGVTSLKLLHLVVPRIRP